MHRRPDIRSPLSTPFAHKIGMYWRDTPIIAAASVCEIRGERLFCGSLGIVVRVSALRHAIRYALRKTIVNTTEQRKGYVHNRFAEDSGGH